MNDTSDLYAIAENDSRSRIILDALLSLPQAGYFKPEHLKRFLDTYRDDPRALWHVSRLSGIGGSEIGIMVAALRGEQDAFGMTPADVIREKLLVVPPKRATLAMRKGIVAETCIRQFFLEDYKAERDMASIQLLEDGQFKRPHEWMRYSPDDIVMIGGRRYLCDYKHPSEAKLHDDVYLRYISQLHLGKMILEYNSVRIDGMLLIQYPEKGNDLVVSEVATDDSVADDILRGGEMTWNEVLAGRVPPFEFHDDLPHELSDEDRSELARLSAEFAKNKVMADALYKDVADIKTKIEQIVVPRALEKGTKLTLDGINVNVLSETFDVDVAVAAIGDDAASACVPVYSADRMLAYLRNTGMDLGQFETGEQQYDETRLRDLMKERMLTERQFMKQSLRMTLTCNNDYKEAARAAAIGARDNFQVAVENKTPGGKPKLKGA